jgi:hypothetical protein
MYIWADSVLADIDRHNRKPFRSFIILIR